MNKQELIDRVAQLFIEAEQSAEWRLDRRKNNTDDELVVIAVFGNNNYLSYQPETALKRVLDEGLEPLIDTMQEVWDNLEDMSCCAICGKIGGHN